MKYESRRISIRISRILSATIRQEWKLFLSFFFLNDRETLKNIECIYNGIHYRHAIEATSKLDVSRSRSWRGGGGTVVDVEFLLDDLSVCVRKDQYIEYPPVKFPSVKARFPLFSPSRYFEYFFSNFDDNTIIGSLVKFLEEG